jgi:hypothetical protein
MLVMNITFMNQNMGQLMKVNDETLKLLLDAISDLQRRVTDLEDALYGDEQ